MKHKLRNLYFIGIGGSGMSGIAEVLLNLGFRVGGSDLNSTAITRRLEKLGAVINIGHRAENLIDVDAVVISSAVPADNPEVREARRRALPIVPRATMLAELMRMRQSIAVAGTHGKTSSTSLIAAVLGEAGLDPTYVIGGQLNASVSNAKLGTGEYMVVEADESDGSFLSLYPVMAMVTNIDRDHLENYKQDFIELKKAFIKFLDHLPFYGSAVLCSDDAAIRDILPFVSRPVIRYGVEDNADYRAVNIRAQGRQMHYTLIRSPRLGRGGPCEVVVNLPGHHNVLNSLGAFAVADELGIEDAPILKALAEFKGVGRRCEEIGQFTTKDGGTAMVIEDYGHHPTEMKATINAIAGAYPQKQLWLVFQPHRYTRTRDCFDEFAACLRAQQRFVLTEVYAAGEKTIPSADGASLYKAALLKTTAPDEQCFMPKVEDIAPWMLANAKAEDLFLVMGAGSIGAQVRMGLSQSALFRAHQH